MTFISIQCSHHSTSLLIVLFSQVFVYGEKHSMYIHTTHIHMLWYTQYIQVGATCGLGNPQGLSKFTHPGSGPLHSQLPLSCKFNSWNWKCCLCYNSWLSPVKNHLPLQMRKWSLIPTGTIFHSCFGVEIDISIFQASVTSALFIASFTKLKALILDTLAHILRVIEIKEHIARILISLATKTSKLVQN